LEEVPIDYSREIDEDGNVIYVSKLTGGYSLVHPRSSEWKNVLADDRYIEYL
jgi:hypothetical protein